MICTFICFMFYISNVITAPFFKSNKIIECICNLCHCVFCWRMIFVKKNPKRFFENGALSFFTVSKKHA